MQQKQLVSALSWLYLAILVLLPFHAFLTTWAGSAVGQLDVWRIWKDILIFLTIPAGIYLAWTNPPYRSWLRRSWLLRLIGIYVFLYILTGLFALQAGSVNGSALVYSLLANLRYLGFFLLVSAVAARSPFLRRYAPKAILWAGAMVIGFGLLQLILPTDFLRHFGYGPETIPAYHTVDNKLDYQRIQSTLRGPNPLGAYLVVLLSMVFAYWRLSRERFSLRPGLYYVAAVAALFFSYSRSAYMGVLLSAAIILTLTIRADKIRKYAVVSLCVAALAGAGMAAARNVNVVQNTFFHSDETSASAESSNANRLKALGKGWEDVVHEPFGRGPGTAGPASVRNSGHSARIAENYYLQIGQEVGWLGIALFVAINVMAARLLWLRRQDWLSLALLASLIGLSLVNLVSHAWADDTLGLLWWGCLGIAVTPAILEQKANKHEAQSSKKTKKRA
jgi:hypothetical protein